MRGAVYGNSGFSCVWSELICSMTRQPVLMLAISVIITRSCFLTDPGLVTIEELIMKSILNKYIFCLVVVVVMFMCVGLSMSQDFNIVEIENALNDTSTISLAISNEYLYLNTVYDPIINDPRLLIFDISDPDRPTLTISCEIFSVGFILLSNNLLFFTGDLGLSIIDVSDVLNPELIFMLEEDDANYNYSMQVGSYYYVSAGSRNDGRIEVFNVSNPGNIYHETDIELPYEPAGITLHDSILYLGAHFSDGRQSGLRVYQMIDSLHFEPIAAVRITNRSMKGFQYDYPYLYAWAGQAVFAYNIADPFNPELISEFHRIGPTPLSDILLRGDDLYVSTNLVMDGPETGIFVYNVSNPAEPILTGQLLDGIGAFSLALDPSGRYLYGSSIWGDHEGRWGLTVWDCAAAANLPLVIPLQANRFELVSSTVEPDTLIPLSVFGELEHLLIAYDVEGGIYIPDWVDTIGEIDVTMGYSLFNSEADSLVLMGSYIDTETTYHLAGNRWSWLGYPHYLPVAPEVALAEVWDDLEIILDDDGRFYIPGVVNNMEAMQPGKGYYVFSYTERDFQYNLGEEEIVFETPGIPSSGSVFQVDRDTPWGQTAFPLSDLPASHTWCLFHWVMSWQRCIQT